jgi:hypothetical protein
MNTHIPPWRSALASACGSIAVFFASLLFAPAFAAPSITFVGPLEPSRTTVTSVRVLGNDIAAAPKLSRAILSSIALQAESNVFVAAQGVITNSGAVQIRTVTVLRDQAYVPGATRIYVSGRVTAVSSRTGDYTVEGLIVSPNNAAIASNLPALGDFVEVLGTQPLQSGPILATTIQVAANGVIGSGTNGIIGSGTNGIIGSGTNGIIGSGTNGIIGSGTNGIIGSGTNGIIGSGTNGIIGSGTNGIIGSGTNGIIGSGTNGIIGSGTNGIIGSGTNGIIGSGAE